MGHHFMFVPLMQRGHTNQLVGLMQHLQQRGHSLAVYGNPRRHIADQFHNAGIVCRWFPEQEEEPIHPSRVQLGSRVQDPNWYRGWYSLGVKANLNPQRVAGIRQAIRDFGTTVVCADAMSYDACVASRLEGLPWAAVAALMMSAGAPDWSFPFKDIADELKPKIVDLMASYGAGDTEMISTDVVSPWLNVLFSTQQLFPRSLSGNRHSWYVGVSRPLGRRGDEPEFPWDRLREDVPIVYVSSGGGHALSFDIETYRKITSSLEPHEAQFVCSMGELMSHPLVHEMGEHVIAVSYAPQLSLLERRASVVVTHGGINSVNEALMHGRPLLVIPISHDQPLQALAVERAGAGLSLDLANLSKENCRAALLRLLRESGFRDAAGGIGVSYRGRDGAAATADLLCRLAEARAPLLPPDVAP